MGINRFFRGRQVAIREFSEYLDELSQAERIRQAISLSADQQTALWDAAAGFRPVTIEDIVPADRGPLEQVIHHGKNSLPAFTKFQKRFCRTDEDGSAELWGYNHQLMSPLTGPGYFVSVDTGDGEVLIDYLRLPPRKPAQWPKIVPNSAGLSRFIYNGTQDILRGVSTHVTIGRATRKGKPMDNWFVLCREE